MPDEYNTNPFGDIGSSILDGINSTADYIVGKQIEFILKPVGMAIAEGFTALITLLNTYSVELITIGVIACGLGMMLGPLYTPKQSWFSRLGLTLIIGTVWRALI